MAELIIAFIVGVIVGVGGLIAVAFAYDKRRNR